MYFIFSKILLFLIFPLNWIIIFLLIALLSRRQKLKRKCLITGLALLIVFSNPLLLYLFAKKWDVGSAPLNKNKVYSSVILLGGFSGEDKNGNGVFNENADRFIQAVKLKQQGRVSHILISSGNGNLRQSEFKEAVWVQHVLKEFNLPDSAVLIESNSRNTFENAAFSKLVLQKAQLPPPYVLVTSAYHMRRSLYIFKKAGIDVIPYSSGRITGNAKFSFIDCMMPQASALLDWSIYEKEIIGLTVAHVKL